MSNLKDRVKALNGTPAIMNDKEKGDIDTLTGVVVNIDAFDFTNGKYGEFVVFTTTQEPELFYFGGRVLKDKLKALNESTTQAEISAETIPTLLTKKTSPKSGRVYTDVEFYPGE